MDRVIGFNLPDLFNGFMRNLVVNPTLCYSYGLVTLNQFDRGYQNVRFFFLSMLIVVAGFWAQAQVDITEQDVVHCETLEDTKSAIQNGAEIYEYNGRYWVKVENTYKGSFPTFQSARKIWIHYNGSKSPSIQANPPKSATSTIQPTTAAAGGAFHNPELVLFPFLSVENKTLLFMLPSNQKIEPSKVFIHPEPLIIEEVSFGIIDPNLIYETLKQTDKIRQQIGVEPPVVSPVAKMPDPQFAITGTLVAREGIALATSSLTYWIGAAVIGKDGNVLWSKYGSVEPDMSFKCIDNSKTTTIEPELLLLFVLAKGHLEKNLRPSDIFPVFDASSYEYHILGSATLEMGPNWYPPVGKTIQEEYKKLLEMYKKRGTR